MGRSKNCVSTRRGQFLQQDVKGLAISFALEGKSTSTKTFGCNRYVPYCKTKHHPRGVNLSPSAQKASSNFSHGNNGLVVTDGNIRKARESPINWPTMIQLWEKFPTFKHYIVTERIDQEKGKQEKTSNSQHNMKRKVKNKKEKNTEPAHKKQVKVTEDAGDIEESEEEEDEESGEEEDEESGEEEDEESGEEEDELSQSQRKKKMKGSKKHCYQKHKTSKMEWKTNSNATVDSKIAGDDTPSSTKSMFETNKPTTSSGAGEIPGMVSTNETIWKTSAVRLDKKGKDSKSIKAANQKRTSVSESPVKEKNVISTRQSKKLNNAKQRIPRSPSSESKQMQKIPHKLKDRRQVARNKQTTVIHTKAPDKVKSTQKISARKYKIKCLKPKRSIKGKDIKTKKGLLQKPRGKMHVTKKGTEKRTRMSVSPKRLRVKKFRKRNQSRRKSSKKSKNKKARK